MVTMLSPLAWFMMQGGVFLEVFRTKQFFEKLSVLHFRQRWADFLVTLHSTCLFFVALLLSLPL